MEEIKFQLSNLHLSGMARQWQILEETRRTGELSLADGMALKPVSGMKTATGDC